MGKKTIPFINKKNATTYSLTYGAEEHDDRGDANSVVQESEVCYPYDDTYSAYGSELEYGCSPYEDEGYVMTEARRKELIELGFPDDGYDYLRHLKELGPSGRKPSSRRDQKVQAEASTSSSAVVSTSEIEQKVVEAAASPAVVEGEGKGQEESEKEEAGIVGPSVFVSGKFIPPTEDQKLLDARQLVVAGKAEKEEDVDKAVAAVSAFARVQNRNKLTRGKIVHDLKDIEASMAFVESKEESARKVAAAEELSKGQGTTVVEVISKAEVSQDGEDGEDGDWGDWFDDFVVEAAKEGPVATIREDGPEISQGYQSAEEDEDGDGGQEASEEQGLIEVLGEGAGAERKGAVVGGCVNAAAKSGYAASIASSYWRPERQDRKGHLGGLDERFETLATQYEGEALGELEEEDAEKARNHADISEYAGMLDEFLLEQAEMELAMQKEALPVGGAGNKSTAAQRAAALLAEELGGDIEDYVGGGEEFEGVQGLNGSDDEDAQGSKKKVEGVEGTVVPVYRKVQALDQVDPEVIAKTRERIAAAEAEAVKRLEVAGDKADETEDHGLAGEAGDLFNEQLPQVFVEREDRWDCESVLSLRSNLDNHPAKIAEPQRRAGSRGAGTIKLSNKTGMPAAYVAGSTTSGHREGNDFECQTSNEVVKQQVCNDAEDSSSNVSDSGHVEQDEGRVIILERKRDETAEEKRLRKASVKDAKREAREAKKALKTMFKEEGTKQKKQAAGHISGAPAGKSTFLIA
ncbi:hypothetical protein CEUSTIGMA_g5524.t1 [Chlamydomonas eustigma]|uniref:Protein LTV1 homolog n=1 Tax=Chlamydomonas eustigma TaxID=1157962 RepID=A0A250X5B8_9CHLO|nr:hypothetical protein CEUSTIGMA_g5524.t1 [Chlamydomonas eustigma]|eukprot:GAX78082.1 hypothetical protein CEUSTIGMA_g5524.t1 [Chlamydomonas eustigma]